MNLSRSAALRPRALLPRSRARKSLDAVVVFPCAGVDRAAAQADEDGQVLDADRALELAGAAGGALEDGFLGVVFAEQRLLGGRAEVVEVGAQAENDFFGVEQLAGVGGGAVLGAAAALHAGVGLQADQLGEVGAGDQAEVFIARSSGGIWLKLPRERKTVAGLSTRCRCLVWGMMGRKVSSASV